MIKAILNDFAENTYIINEKAEAYIIDPGTNYKEIKEYLNKKHFTVLGILLTHGHFDHIVAVNDLVKDYGAKVYIHEKERDFLFDPNLNLSGLTYKRFTVNDKSKVITFTENDKIKLGNESIRIIETPGHTKGGVCYKYKNFLFSGDTLFKGTIGRTDLPTSNTLDIQKSIKKIFKICRDNTIVYPGHGHFTTVLNEKRDNPFVKS
ncbi:MAG: MBL fold metallo-hydrolase [Candidatus Izimaplasma sp.]|nr:MBL fold metallo-hydrolase [Candidatus Izimaplasma bacterium]